MDDARKSRLLGAPSTVRLACAAGLAVVAMLCLPIAAWAEASPTALSIPPHPGASWLQPATQGVPATDGASSHAAESASVASNVLIVEGSDDPGDEGNTEPDTDLHTILQSDGYNVTVSETVPASLAPYGSVWYVGTDPLDADDQVILEDFVRSGRGLYLTGERPCCEALDSSDQVVVRALTGQQDIQVSDDDDVDSESLYGNSVNPEAIDGVTGVPDPVSTWVPNAPGVIIGVQPNNIMTEGYQNGSLIATGAAWDSSELGGQGHLVELMDINWLEADYGNLTDAAPLIADIEHFLASGVQGQFTPTGAKYVALGDSFSSGEGNPQFIGGGNPDGCDRSETGAYPDVIAKDLFGSTNSSSFSFQACSGATTADMWAGSPDDMHKNITPEETSLGYNTRLVTVTAGGDDVDFTTVLEGCISGGVFDGFLGFADVGGCPDPAGWVVGSIRHATSKIEALENTLVGFYRSIEDYAPNAQVYVLGYPDIFQSSDVLGDGTCVPASGMTPGSIDWLVTEEGYLDSVIKSAAQEAGVHYVDPNQEGPSYSFLGHDICSIDSSWFHKLYDERSYHDLTTFSFHPTVAGQDALAAALVAAGATKVNVGSSPAVAAATTGDGSGAARAASVAPAGGSDDPDDASISGAVSNASGPVAGVDVDLYDSSGDFVTSVQTASGGAYSMSDLPGGTYTVQFNAASLNYVEQYYDDASGPATADPITLAPGAAVTGIDATLVAGGSISGTVTATNDDPIAGAQVTVAATDGSGAGGTATTASDGTYTILGLPAGSYTVEFDPNGQNYIGQFYNSEDGIAAADPVTVAVGAGVTSINASLAAGASVSGKVTGTGGNPIGGVEVYIEPIDGSSSGASAFTGSAGAYTVPGLAAGEYTVQFEPDGQDYIGQFYNDETSVGSADPLTVAAGSVTTGIDSSLVTQGTISGLVTDPQGRPIAGVQVYAVATDASGDGGTATTAADGTYTVTGLPANNYTVEFDPDGQNYVDQYFNDRSAQGSPDPITVTAGAAETGIDASLASGATISGSVVDSQGDPIAGVEVDVLAADGNGASATTGTDGTYTVSGLPADTYDVGFDPSGQNYLAQFYNGQPSDAHAAPVAVAAGGSDSAVNASLASGGSISGTVTDSQGNPVAGVEVDAFTSDCSTAGTDAITDASGDYTIVGLPTDSYEVEFDPDGGAYDTVLGSSDVAVTEGNASSGIDATLPLSGDGVVTPGLTCGQTPAPVSSAPPTIAGTAKQGQTLTETHGSWDNRPMSYAYQWEDCDSSGANCSTISGATSQSYSLTSSDVGRTIVVQETAANAGGQGSAAVSGPTQVVAAAAGFSGTAGSGGGAAAATGGSGGAPGGGGSVIKRGSVSVRKVSVRGDVAVVAVACSKPIACQATLTLSVVETLRGGRVVAITASRSPARRALTLASKTVTIAADHTKSVRLALDSEAQRLLKSRRELKAELTVKSGRKSVYARVVTVRAPSRRRA